MADHNETPCRDQPHQKVTFSRTVKLKLLRVATLTCAAKLTLHLNSKIGRCAGLIIMNSTGKSHDSPQWRKTEGSNLFLSITRKSNTAYQRTKYWLFSEGHLLLLYPVNSRRYTEGKFSNSSFSCTRNSSRTPERILVILPLLKRASFIDGSNKESFPQTLCSCRAISLQSFAQLLGN